MTDDFGDSYGFLNINEENDSIKKETLCMNCSEIGFTTLIKTNIKSFRDIQISHFKCSHCDYSYDSIQFVGEIPKRGVHCVLHVKTINDLKRNFIKSCNCTVSIPSLNFKIPVSTQGDVISTIEGVLNHSISCLQNETKQNTKLDEFIQKMKEYLTGNINFDFIIDDPSGNSLIEKYNDEDNNVEVKYYERTEEQKENIYLTEKRKSEDISIDECHRDKIESVFAEDNQIMTFPVSCGCCSKEGTLKSCSLIIPHFKEIVIMTFRCDYCGYHKSEYIICGSISTRGRSISLYCDSNNDLKREILKSETASIIIPECDFEMSQGSIGGKFTTIEGLLEDICNNLKENNPFTRDKSDFSDLTIYNHLIDTLTKYKNNELPFTIIINDSLSNSYIQKYSNDDKLEILDYDRSIEDNEELGINDMKTEEYIIENTSIYTEQKPFTQNIKLSNIFKV